MSCWALVPVKRRGEGKRRLAGHLSAPERLQLIRHMLAQTIAALRQTQGLDGIAFVSAERDTIPREFLVLDDPGGGPNAALAAARADLAARGATALVVVAADLPRLTGPDLDALITAGRRTGFALAPDAAGTGTNALYLPAQPAFEFHFGPGSRTLHLAEAQRLGLEATLVERPGLAFDLDDPEDLDRMRVHNECRYTPQPPGPETPAA
ncbi:MAG: 2-phospho-L-lactate guanylyltransferase [Gammaproteobacteria bacterium]|nr:2-phospho-L-lactate guanylyltransferase [Gammaproteobacteria bacterium]